MTKTKTYKFINHLFKDNNYIYQCDCCDREAPAKNMVWIQTDLTAPDGEGGTYLCYGKSCWRKIKKEMEG